MLTVILFISHLEAIVRQMYVFVSHVRVVVGAGGPDIPCITEIEILVTQRYSPDSDIKLAVLVEKWPLEVLLHDPVGVVE